MQFALCLRMRHDKIERVSIGKKDVEFETFRDKCSTFLYVPLTMTKAGSVKLTIDHPKY